MPSFAVPCIYRAKLKTYLPVHKDAGGVSAAPQTRNEAIGPENSETAESGEHAKRQIHMGDAVFETGTEVGTVLVFEAVVQYVLYIFCRLALWEVLAHLLVEQCDHGVASLALICGLFAHGSLGTYVMIPDLPAAHESGKFLKGRLCECIVPMF